MVKTVTAKALIREMDAHELQNEAQRLYNDYRWSRYKNRVAIPLIELCKKNYLQLTGTAMQLQYFSKN